MEQLMGGIDEVSATIGGLRSDVRNLTEQVYGQQLDASSTVADMVVTNDTFRTKVEGVIYGARLVSITPVGEDTYETTLSLDKDVVQDLRVLYMSQLASKGR
jgi:hypothetical protein